jgi:hypothetical protein
MQISKYFLSHATAIAGNSSWMTDSVAMAIVYMLIAG